MKDILKKLSFNNTTFKTKIIIHFTVITIILISIFFITYSYLEKEIQKTYNDKIISIREIKKNHLEYFFEQKKAQVIRYSNIPFIKEASIKLSSPYSKEDYRRYDGIFRKYLESNEFSNIYIINTSNDQIIYSLNTKSNEGKKISEKIFNSSNFQQLYYSIIIDPDYIKLVDFEFFKADNGKPSAFFATPIFDNKLNIISVMIIQLSIHRIEKIMTGDRNWQKEGLGQSGETYIVANDCKMRSNSRFYIQNPSYFLEQLEKNGISKEIINMTKIYDTNVLIQKIDEKYCHRLFIENKSGIDIVKDYRGIYVLSAYAPLNINGVNWFILSKIDKSEITIPIKFLKDTSTITIIILFILLFLSTHLFSNAIAKPINKIKESFEELGRGDLSNRIIINRNNEFSSLAKSYNRAINKLQKLTQSVEYLSILSTTDFLTKIYNRRKFEEELINNIQRTHRTKEQFCIAILDIDHFKKVNDIYGHDRGDKTLISFTRSVKKNLRKTDIFARWGGEEFIVLFIDTKISDANLVCEKIRKNLEEQYFEEIKNLSCSIGITQNKKEDDIKSIIDRADKALYKAKKSGRNQVIQN